MQLSNSVSAILGLLVLFAVPSWPSYTCSGTDSAAYGLIGLIIERHCCRCLPATADIINGWIFARYRALA